mgnify:FL=1
MKLLWLILLKLEHVIDLENGGAKVMRKESMMISGLNEEGYTFPSPMTLRFQAIRSACQFQRKCRIVSLAGLLLIITVIVSALLIVASKDSTPENTMSSTYSTPSYTTSSTPKPNPLSNLSKAN